VTARAPVGAWVDAYVAAWRTPGVEALRELFADDARYVVSPWKEPIVGLDAIGRFWEAGRTSADEVFELTSEVVAVDGEVGVVRVAVDYGTGSRWKDLWIIHLGADGRCTVFEEWPFAPGQHDGQDDVPETS
jgi:ketosteroid isomerase-like protein